MSFEKSENEAERKLERAEFILRRLGLGWGDLEGKKILDIGADSAELAQAAKDKGISVVSMDINSEDAGKASKETMYVQGSALRLPFNDESFEMVIAHAAPPALLVKSKEDLATIIDEIKRVLKEGGELRFGPSGSLGEAIPEEFFPEEGSEFSTEESIRIIHEKSLEMLQGIDPGVSEVQSGETGFYILTKHTASSVK